MGRSLVVLVSLLTSVGLAMERWNTLPDIRDDWEAACETLYRYLISSETVSWEEVSGCIRRLTATYEAAVEFRAVREEGDTRDR